MQTSSKNLHLLIVNSVSTRSASCSNQFLHWFTDHSCVPALHQLKSPQAIIASDTFLFSPLEQSASHPFPHICQESLRTKLHSNEPAVTTVYIHVINLITFALPREYCHQNSTFILFAIDQHKILPDWCGDRECGHNKLSHSSAYRFRRKGKSPRQIANWPINGAHVGEKCRWSENYKRTQILKSSVALLLFSSDSTGAHVPREIIVKWYIRRVVRLYSASRLFSHLVMAFILNCWVSQKNEAAAARQRERKVLEQN